MFKISDEQRDVLVIDSLKDDYIFLREQMAAYKTKESVTDADEDNYLTDSVNATLVCGVLKYYMNHEDFRTFIDIVKKRLTLKLKRYKIKLRL